MWKIVVKDLESGEQKTLIANYVSLATGHHGLPLEAKFYGQETFTGFLIWLINFNSNFYLRINSFNFILGDIIHSVKYKSSSMNNMTGKRVLVVGIGNSAVDVTVNLVNEGRYKLINWIM